jgi:hypothetical protein
MSLFKREGEEKEEEEEKEEKEEEEEVCCYAKLSTYTERLNLPLIKEETPFLKYVNI